MFDSILPFLALKFLVFRSCSVSSICDKQVSLSYDESPNCTIKIRSSISHSGILNFDELSRISSGVNFSIESKFLQQIPENFHSDEQ